MAGDWNNDMSQAPRDGTLVDLWIDRNPWGVPLAEPYRIADCQWDDRHKEWMTYSRSERVRIFTSDSTARAWMLSPDPPKEEP